MDLSNDSTAATTSSVRAKKRRAPSGFMKTRVLEETAQGTEVADTSSTKALNNPLILDNILKYVPSEDLPQLRRTCKAWNSAIIPLMRKSHVELKFSRGYKKRGYSKSVCERECRKQIRHLRIFVDVMKMSDSIPFGSYHINDMSLKEPAMEQLFEVCGKHMQNLKLTFTEQNQAPITYLRKFIARASPVLRVLKISDEYTYPPSDFWRKRLNSENVKQPISLPVLQKFTARFDVDRSYKEGYSFVADVILAAPNLGRIKLDIPRRDEDEENENFHDETYLQLFETMKSKDNLDKLQEVNISEMTLEELETLEGLSKTGLKLKKFDTACIQSHEIGKDGGQRLTKFLETNSNNLEILNLIVEEGYGENLPIVICLPKMKKLKELVMKIRMEDSQNIQVDFNSFKESFPNLKVFTYHYDEVTDEEGAQQQSNWQRFFPSEPHVGLERLSVDGINTQEKLQDLVTTFPNLRSLIIKLNDSNGSFSSLWVGWPQLEELNVRFGVHTDWSLLGSLITGIPDETMNEWKKQGKLLVTIDQLLSAKVQAGLIDLKGLKKFTINLGYQLPTRNSVMDNCGYYGFAMLTTLQELNIYRKHPRHPMSAECRAAIKESLGTQAVVRFQQKR